MAIAPLSGVRLYGDRRYFALSTGFSRLAIRDGDRPNAALYQMLIF